MNNLFVCHSQAHLILAAGLSKGRFLNEQNDLILFTDFAISEGMKSRLTRVFDRILFRTGIYPVVNKAWREKLKRYPEDWQAIKAFQSKAYTRVFFVIDGNIPELFIMKRAMNLNSAVELIWLEDGAFPYFQNTVDLDGLSSNSFTKVLRNVALKYLLGLGKVCEFEGDFLGANKNIRTIYLTFKGHERSIYRSKEKVEITAEEYRNGLHLLFSEADVSLEDGAIVLVLDKFNVYKDLTAIKKLVVELGTVAKRLGRKLYYKAHPREEEHLSELDDCPALDKNIGIENYYAAAIKKDIVVIGIKSTGLQTSKLLGFKTVSLAGIVNEYDPEILAFYEKIGVRVLQNKDELAEVLTL